MPLNSWTFQRNNAPNWSELLVTFISLESRNLNLERYSTICISNRNITSRFIPKGCRTPMGSAYLHETRSLDEISTSRAVLDRARLILIVSWPSSSLKKKTILNEISVIYLQSLFLPGKSWVVLGNLISPHEFSPTFPSFLDLPQVSLIFPDLLPVFSTKSGTSGAVCRAAW